MAKRRRSRKFKIAGVSGSTIALAAVGYYLYKKGAFAGGSGTTALAPSAPSSISVESSGMAGFGDGVGVVWTPGLVIAGLALAVIAAPSLAKVLDSGSSKSRRRRRA